MVLQDVSSSSFSKLLEDNRRSQRLSILDARTPIDLFSLDPEGCESCISSMSDRGFVAVDALLLDVTSIKIASSLISNSSLNFSILSSFCCSVLTGLNQLIF